jgi:hypothetical protein
MSIHGGAAADVSELEYISALHQTGPTLRKNGTVSATDVQRFLISRYGIRISHKVAIDIIRGLGGGSFQPPISVAFAGRNKRLFHRNRKNASKNKKDDETIDNSRQEEKGEESLEEDSKHASIKDEESLEKNSNHARIIDEESLEKGPKRAGNIEEEPEEYMDLVQILAILLIPALARFRNMDTNQKNVVESNPSSNLDPQPPSLMNDALKVLLKNISVDEDGNMFPLVDVELVEALLLDVGEIERSQDQKLLREMVAVATTPSGRLDVEAFVQACTSDISAWNAGSEDRFTTFLEDVELMCLSAEDGDKKLEVSQEIMRKSIDYVIDSHTSIMILLLVWAFFFFTSITYGALFQSSVYSQCEKNGDDDFGCILGSTIATWCVLQSK